CRTAVRRAGRLPRPRRLGRLGARPRPPEGSLRRAGPRLRRRARALPRPRGRLRTVALPWRSHQGPDRMAPPDPVPGVPGVGRGVAVGRPLWRAVLAWVLAQGQATRGAARPNGWRLAALPAPVGWSERADRSG